jgi:hypothetical protein
MPYPTTQEIHAMWGRLREARERVDAAQAVCDAGDWELDGVESETAWARADEELQAAQEECYAIDIDLALAIEQRRIHGQPAVKPDPQYT